MKRSPSVCLSVAAVVRVRSGQNFYPHDIEDAVRRCHIAIRPGSVVAVATTGPEGEGLAVIVELNAGEGGGEASGGGGGAAAGEATQLGKKDIAMAQKAFKLAQRLPAAARGPAIRGLAKLGAWWMSSGGGKEGGGERQQKGTEVAAPGGPTDAKLQSVETAIKRAVLSRFGIPVADVILARAVSTSYTHTHLHAHPADVVHLSSLSLCVPPPLSPTARGVEDEQRQDPAHGHSGGAAGRRARREYHTPLLRPLQPHYHRHPHLLLRPPLHRPVQGAAAAGQPLETRAPPHLHRSPAQPHPQQLRTPGPLPPRREAPRGLHPGRGAEAGRRHRAQPVRDLHVRRGEDAGPLRPRQRHRHEGGGSTGGGVRPARPAQSLHVPRRPHARRPLQRRHPPLQHSARRTVRSGEGARGGAAGGGTCSGGGVGVQEGGSRRCPASSGSDASPPAPARRSWPSWR